MDNSNIIHTFPASDLEGKSLEGIFSFYRELLRSARAEGYQDFELIWNEDESAYTAIGLDEMSDYVIPPSSMALILEGLGFNE